MAKSSKRAKGNPVTQNHYGLTLRQEKFITNYLQTGNATQSALNAGYSRTSAHLTGSSLLKNPIVREIINRRVEARHADADEILSGLSIHSRVDMADYMALRLPDGRFDWEKIKAQGMGYGVREYKETPVELQVTDKMIEPCPNCQCPGVFPALFTRYEVSIKLHDSQKANERLAKIGGMFQSDRKNDIDVKREQDNLIALQETAQLILTDARQTLNTDTRGALAWMKAQTSDSADLVAYLPDNPDEPVVYALPADPEPTASNPDNQNNPDNNDSLQINPEPDSGHTE